MSETLRASALVPRGFAVDEVTSDGVSALSVQVRTNRAATPASAVRGQAGNSLMREAMQKLDLAAQDAERERRQLTGLIGTMRTRWTSSAAGFGAAAVWRGRQLL